MEYKYLGKRIMREDSYERAIGKTQYTLDMERKDVLFAKLILSTKAHAKYSLDISEAVKVDGIVKIYTSKDVEHTNYYNSMEWFTGIQGKRDEKLINDVARFVGDRIGIVVGKSKDSVEKALAKIKVNYEELKAVVDLKDSIKDEFIIKNDTNLCYKKSIAYGDFEQSKKDADYIVKTSGSTQKIHHLAIEPHVCLSEIDIFGNLIVWTPCQVAFAVQMHISRILDFPYNKVRVIKSNMGGSFGGKQQPILEPLSAFITLDLKKPIMLYMDRYDTLVGTVSRNPVQVDIETAVTKEGKILGRKIDAYVDGGAYDTNATSIVNAFMKKLFRLYEIPSQCAEGKSYYTNTIPGGAARAYGGPQSHAISELNIDDVARKLNMDPCELRLLNLAKPYQDDPTGGPNLGNAQVIECMKQGMERFDWYKRKENIYKKNTDRYAYGIGVAAATHGNGYKGAFPDFCNVEFTLFSDSTALVKISVHEQGCGTIASLTQIAAEALDLEPAKIRMTEADTLYTPYDAAGTQASRVTFVNGGAIKKAGEQLREKLINTAVQLKNFDRKDIYTDNGKVFCKKTGESVDYSELVKFAEKNNFEAMTVYVHHEQEANPASFAVFFVEVKIDKYTGIVEITDSLAVHDIGQSVNPSLVEGQIYGGAHMSLGMALSEEIVYDEKGNVKTNSLSKYHVLNSQDMPKIDILLIESEDESAPYGIKSVGEMSCVAPAPAVMNAINNALGTNITNYPATPEKIIEAIVEKESSINN